VIALFTLHPIVAVLLAVGATLAIVSGRVISAMIGEVNRRLPDDQQISYLWGYPGKLSGIREQYKRFYPKGTLSKVLTVLEVSFLMVMAACALLVGLASQNL
jgi:hypothetical protein